jgi:diadenosine tetraphosphatase ApaH/serine/threonine PP2A family protein phosphatase
MRVAIFSDVHANLHALRAVLEDVDRRRVDARACLGDNVGYGAEPRECLDLLFESCTALLAGNHDLAAAGQLSDSRFSGLARHAVEFARRELTPSQRARLGRLPNEELFGELLLVHASPADPADFPYVRDAASAREQFDARPFRLALYGHTHLPLVFEDDGERVALSMRPTVPLAPDARYLCNVGSVGQPRDQDPRACYAIYDSIARTIAFHRVEYDVDAASSRIRAVGLPEELGTRLLVGV